MEDPFPEELPTCCKGLFEEPRFFQPQAEQKLLSRTPWAESARRGECPPIGLADGQVVVDRNGKVAGRVPAAATFPWWKPLAGGAVCFFNIDVSRNHHQVAGDVISEAHSLSLRPLCSTHIPCRGKWEEVVDMTLLPLVGKVTPGVGINTGREEAQHLRTSIDTVVAARGIRVISPCSAETAAG